MTDLFLSTISAYASYIKANFVRQTCRPMVAQERYLRRLLQVQQGTELGQKFGLASIRTIEQFRQQVPIWSYQDYEPYADRVWQGEPNVLTADPVIYINLTSGSTGKQKKVPVTRRFQRSLDTAHIASSGFLLEASKTFPTRQQRPFQLGKILSANSARLQGHTPAGIPYGPVTVGSLRMSKPVCQFTFVQPYEVMEIADSASRHYAALLFALSNPDLRCIVANFPMLVLRLCHYLEQYADELIADLAAGTIAPWLKLEPERRAKLEQMRYPLPDRAAHLQDIIRAEGRLIPIAAWSQLAIVGTARGGTSDFYFERFPDYFGATPCFGGVFGTAEGTFGIYPTLNTDGSILALNSGFYEFIAPDQWDAAQPKTLLPTEVKVGERYRLLVTSYSGFYRYDIGDVVEVVGFYHETPMIVFRYRRGGLLSSTTEKTTEFHVIQAMQALQQEFGIALEDFCITLSEHEVPAHYLVNIELATEQHLANPQAFLSRFDYWMGEFNHPYATVRKDQVPPPRLRILAPGSFAIVRQRQLLRGTSDSQLKIPHIHEDRRFLDGLEILQEFHLPSDASLSMASISP